MSHKRINQLTVSGEWAKHLRPWHRRAFWKGERHAAQALVRTELSQATPALDRPRSEYDSKTMPTKVKELIELLENNGWRCVRQKGSHRQYHHASKPGTVTVAGKPSIEVPPGTLNSVLKQAGLKK
jgi:predicted RNA binding protein YcfA (HicA-like mRNA interferase family)